MAGRKEKHRAMTQLVLSARGARTALSVRLAALGLYPGQDAVLIAVGETDGLSLRDLAATLHVRPPTVTKTLARLSAQGLVEKRPAPGDARQSVVHLTTGGVALLGGVRRAQRAVEREALKGVSKRQATLLRKLLRRVERNLAAHPEDGEEAEAG